MRDPLRRYLALDGNGIVVATVGTSTFESMDFGLVASETAMQLSPAKCVLFNRE